jgi:hypothetical protein
MASAFTGDDGMNLLKSTKYQNVLRNNMVAIVIDGNRRTQRRDNRSGVLIQLL